MCGDEGAWFWHEGIVTTNIFYSVRGIVSSSDRTHSKITMFGPSRDAQFTQIPQLEDCESLNSQSEKPRSRTLILGSLLPHICTAILLLVTLVTGAVLGAWLGGNHFIKANEFCIHEVSRDCKAVLSLPNLT